MGMVLDEDEIQEFLKILREEPDGVFAYLVREGQVPRGIPVERPDVAKAIAALNKKKP